MTATAPLHKPLCRATVLPCCRHYCHCLSRGSSNGAGMAVCGGGISNSSGSIGGGGCGIGGGTILLLVIVVILLLLLTSMVGCCVAAPHLHRGPCCPRSSPSSSFSLLGAPRRRDHCPPCARPRARPHPHPHTGPRPCPHPRPSLAIAIAIAIAPTPFSLPSPLLSPFMISPSSLPLP